MIDKLLKEEPDNFLSDDFAGAYYFLNKETFMEIKSFVLNGYTPVAVGIILFVYFMDKVMLKLLNKQK